MRQSAPVAFRTQERAVTEQDYGTMAKLVVDPSLSQAMGTFRWTGSWRTVFISVDPERNRERRVAHGSNDRKRAWNCIAWRAMTSQ